MQITNGWPSGLWRPIWDRVGVPRGFKSPTLFSDKLVGAVHFFKQGSKCVVYSPHALFKPRFLLKKPIAEPTIMVKKPTKVRR